MTAGTFPDRYCPWRNLTPMLEAHQARIKRTGGENACRAGNDLRQKWLSLCVLTQHDQGTPRIVLVLSARDFVTPTIKPTSNHPRPTLASHDGRSPPTSFSKIL